MACVAVQLEPRAYWASTVYTALYNIYVCVSMTKWWQDLKRAWTRQDTSGITAKSVNVVSWCGWDPLCLLQWCSAQWSLHESKSKMLSVSTFQWFQWCCLKHLYIPCFDKQIYSDARYHSADGVTARIKPRLAEHDKANMLMICGYDMTQCRHSMKWHSLGTAW